MNRIYLFISLALISAFSCSEKTKSNSKKPLDHQTLSNPSNNVGENTFANDSGKGIAAQATDQIPEVITKHFEKLRGNSPKIPIYMTAFEELWTVELNQPSDIQKPLSIINQPSEDLQLVRKLREGGSFEGLDRPTSIGLMSLITGWLMDDENKGDFHFILDKMADRESPLVGDVAMAQLMPDAISAGTAGPALRGSQPEEWARLTKARNPVVRQIAAFVLPQLTRSVEDQQKFILEYGDESELEILETVAAGIQRLPRDTAQKTMHRLAERLMESGRIQGANYFEDLSEIYEKTAD